MEPNCARWFPYAAKALFCMSPTIPGLISSAVLRDFPENSVCSSLIKDPGGPGGDLFFAFAIYLHFHISPSSVSQSPLHSIAGGFLGNPLTGRTPKLHISISLPTSSSNKRWLMKQGRDASAPSEITPPRQGTDSVFIHGTTV